MENVQASERRIYSPTVTACDLCKRSLTKAMFDAPVRGNGSWANMCPSCHRSQATQGAGQEYRLEAGQWVKVRDVPKPTDRQRCPKCGGRKLTKAPQCGDCAMRELGF